MMVYKMKYIEVHIPSCDNYGEFEFNDGNGSRFIFGQLWDDYDLKERLYGGYGLVDYSRV